MITLITGKIGSGKTLRAVRLMLDHLGKGGTVFTNVRLNHEELLKFCRFEYRRRIDLEAQLHYMDLVDSDAWHKRIKWGTPALPVLVVLDEIHLFFNARDWQKTQTLHRSMLSFLSQSRKACVDVVFIAQVATTLEKQFRIQCEWEYYCRALRDIKIPIVPMPPLALMLLVKKDVETDKPVSRQFIRYDKRLFPVYDTRAMLDAEMREADGETERVQPLELDKIPLVPLKVWLGGLVATALLVVYYLATS